MTAPEGGNLGELLQGLIRTAESRSDGSFFASIQLLAEDGKHLRHGAAPSLPDEYNQAIDGAEIGPRAGSCGTAAHFGHAIVVTDIERDPLWADYRHLALKHGLRACWSTPFLAQNGSVLGTVALYYRDARGPSESDREAVKLIGGIATQFVESARLQARLALNRPRSAP